jgi:hypothetical protein
MHEVRWSPSDELLPLRVVMDGILDGNSFGESAKAFRRRAADKS